MGIDRALSLEKTSLCNTIKSIVDPQEEQVWKKIFDPEGHIKDEYFAEEKNTLTCFILAAFQILTLHSIYGKNDIVNTIAQAFLGISFGKIHVYAKYRGYTTIQLPDKCGTLQTNVENIEIIFGSLLFNFLFAFYYFLKERLYTNVFKNLICILFLMNLGTKA